MSIVLIGRMKYENHAVMAGLGLGMSLRILFGISILYGFNGGLETYASQAVGAGEIRTTGVILNRGYLIQVFVFLFSSILLTNTYSICIFTGQDSEVAL